jgi:hypothetical protein
MGPALADLGDGVEGDALGVRARIGEDRGEVRGPTLADTPAAPEAAEAQEEQCLLLETEDGQRILSLLSSPSLAPSVGTSGGQPAAPRLSLTINQEGSNLVLVPVPLSIALSIIRPSPLSRRRDTVCRGLAPAAGTSRYTATPHGNTHNERRQK